MRRHHKLALVACLIVSCGISSAGEKHRTGVPKPAVSFARQMLQGYAVRVWLSNQMTMGIQAWDVTWGSDIPAEPHLGMEYPVGSDIEHLSGLGPWIGGIVRGARHVDEAFDLTARHEILPNFRHPLREHFWRTSVGTSERASQPDSLGYSGYYFNHRIIVDRRGCDNDNDGKINEDDLDGMDNDGDWNPLTDDVGTDGLPDSLEVSCDGMPYDPVSNPDPVGDTYNPRMRDKCHPYPDWTLPFKSDPDVWTEKNGIPDHGEPHVDEDYGAVSDNDLYCSATDTFRSPIIAGHVPMGIKVVQKSYAWMGIYAKCILPFDYSFINVGRDEIKDVWVGFYADMDVGPVSVPYYQGHNYAGYIDSVRTAFIHNPIDRGSTPAGITLLKAPRPLDSLTFIFQWFDFTIGPNTELIDSLLYGYMSGEHIRPNQPYTDLSDTRFLISVGPFPTMKPLDTLRFSIALITGDGIAGGENSLVENAQKAIKLSNRRYVPLVVPPSPSLKITQGSKSATLRWGSGVGPVDPLATWDDSNKLAEIYPPNHWRRINPPCTQPAPGLCTGHVCDATGELPGGRIFAGYRLYRSEDQGDQPVPSTFALVHEYMYPDGGSITADWDSVYVDTNLAVKRRYWYALTSLGLPDITIVPVGLPNGGVRYDTLFTEMSESSILENATSVDIEFQASKQSGKVLVVPNPYRTDADYTSGNRGWEGSMTDWTEYERKVKFIHLPEGEWTLRIFTIAGDVVTTLRNVPQDPGYRDDRGEVDWRLLSESGKAIASGVYIFTVESKYGLQTGKFVVIR